MTRQMFLGAFAALFALLMALAMAPNAAFADDLVAAGSVDSAADAYFTVYVSEQTGVDDEGNPVYGEKAAVKSWTEAEFAGLAKTDGLAYAYKSGDKYKAYGTKSYVTLSKVLDAAGVSDKFTFDGRTTIGDTEISNGSLMVGDAIGTYVLKFGADKDDATKAVEDNDKNSIEPVFALSYATSEFNGPAAAAEVETANTALATAKTSAINGTAVTTDCPLFLQGKEKKKNVSKDSAIPKSVKSITLHKPLVGAFVVRTSTDGGKTTKLAKFFKAEDLKALAEKNNESKFYLFNKTIIKAESYATLDQILEASNISFLPGDTLGFDCYDGPWTKSTNMTPEYLANGQFFPAYAFGASYDSNGAESVPAVFALKWGSPKEIASSATASDYATGKQAIKTSDETYPRFCSGTTKEAFEKGGPRPGSDFPSGVNTLTINITATADLSQATVTVADQAYTGSALTPDVVVSLGSTKLVKDRDYTVAYSDNVNPGTAKVAVTAKDPHYTGTASATFQITKSADQSSPAVDSAAVSNINTKTVTAAQIQAAAAAGATSVTLGKNVKSIEAGAFAGTNIKTVTLSTKKLTKKGVKNALKGSKVKTIKVKIKSTKSAKGLKGKALKAAKKYNKKVKALNAKYVKKYKKFFTKANCGKKGVKIK